MRPRAEYQRNTENAETCLLFSYLRVSQAEDHCMEDVVFVFRRADIGHRLPSSPRSATAHLRLNSAVQNTLVPKERTMASGVMHEWHVCNEETKIVSRVTPRNANQTTR